MATISPTQTTLTSPTSSPHLTTGEHSAEIRIERLFSIFVGAGYLGYALILFPTFGEQWSITATWWNIAGLVAVFGPPVVLFIAGLARHRQTMRWASRACAGGLVLATLTWGLAWTGEHLTSHTDLWFTLIPGLAALAAAITMSTRATLVILLAATLPAQIYLAEVRPADYGGSLLANILFAVTFIMLYTAAALMAMRTGRLLDATQADAYADAAAAAEVDARRSQRSHVDALLHDWVISTLLAAARQGNTETVQQQALTTMDKLDSPPPEVTTLSSTTALTRLRAAVLAVDVTQPVRSSISDAAADTRFPVEAIDVLDAAISEALRNSLLHAGNSATRTVHISISRNAGGHNTDDHNTGGHDTIDAEISDDGIGFDVSEVPPHRLGLAVSILSRVRSLPGGSAQVVSAPGAGTIVRLRWASES